LAKLRADLATVASPAHGDLLHERSPSPMSTDDTASNRPLPALADDDPIMVKRATIRRLVSAGKRAGYGMFAAAIVLFVVGFVTSFTTFITSIITFCLVVGSLVLAPAIVFGYGIHAAERHDLGLPDGH